MSTLIVTRGDDSREMKSLEQSRFVRYSAATSSVATPLDSDDASNS